jgi:hypothetical protein
MEADREWVTEADRILQDTKDFVIDQVRPLIFDCRRTAEQAKELNSNIRKALIYLDYVERTLDDKKKPKSFVKYWKNK